MHVNFRFLRPARPARQGEASARRRLDAGQPAARRRL